MKNKKTTAKKPAKVAGTEQAKSAQITALKQQLARDREFNNKITRSELRASGLEIQISNLKIQRETLSREIAIAEDDLRAIKEEAATPRKNVALIEAQIKELEK